MKPGAVRKPRREDLDWLPPDLCLEAPATPNRISGGLIEFLEWRITPEADLARAKKPLVFTLTYWPDTRDFTGSYSFAGGEAELPDVHVATLRRLLTPPELARCIALSITYRSAT